MRRLAAIAAIGVGGTIGMLRAASAQPVLSEQNFLSALRDSASSMWLNGSPLDDRSLRGKVVLVDFWTYSCINSLRNLPYLRNWSQKYRDAGLMVVGVHAPEFSFEKELTNVKPAVARYGVDYPVVLDSDHRIWSAFENDAWPGDYLFDRSGRLRYRHFGEGDYATSERIIQEVLREGGHAVVPAAGEPQFDGIEAPADFANEKSPETYVGYARAENFASPGGFVRDGRKSYVLPKQLELNAWGLAGAWSAGPENAVLGATPGSLAFRFHSRDLHLILATDGATVRYRVRLDGAIPGEDHGLDTIADGTGVAREPRLYQLIRQRGRIRDRTFELEVLEPGLQAFDFTFG